MIRISKSIPVFVLLLGTGLVNTVYPERQAPDQIIVDILPKDQGSVTIVNLNMNEYLKKTVIHELSAEKAVYLQNSQNLDITNLKMNLQTEKGEIAQLSGGKASFDISTKTGIIQDRVRYQTQSGDVLSCSLLKWDMNKDQIIVPGKFTISRENQMLYASNLTTNRSLEEGSMSDIQVIGK